MSHLIAPSILASNFLKLGDDIEMLNESQADWIHVDVMDGHFVPNLSFGLPIIKQVKEIAKKPLDVHLMISNPQQYITRYRDVGADVLTVHAEVCPHLHRTIQEIHAAGMKAGVSLNPHTPIDCLQHVIQDLDLVLIMSVNPGFGGQSFIETTYAKVKALNEMIANAGASTVIEIDGGVSLANAKDLVISGADVLVAGSAVFKADDPKAMIAELKAV